MEQRGIVTVLSRFNDSIDQATSTLKSYGLKFLTETGEKREITCRKYSKGLKQKAIGHDARGKNFYNLQYKGVILLEDITNGRVISAKTDVIYAFREFESDLWFKVFH